MSATFRERFESLVETLRADAGVVVLSAELSPPASAAAIKKAERAAQRALPASMRAFYVLLRQLEAWLHMPKPELPKQVDWANLLQPYRAVTAKSFEPIAPPEAG